MDCVRASTREIKGRAWDAFYYKQDFDAYAQTEDGCRQSCVSKLNCRAWKYNAGNPPVDPPKCLLTFALKGLHPTTVKSPGDHSGLIQCEKSAWSMLKLVLYFILFIIIFSIFAWIVSRCPKK
jgi:hypothetical protein